MHLIKNLFQSLSCLLLCFFLIPESSIKAQFYIPPELLAEAQAHELTSQDIVEYSLAVGRGFSRATKKMLDNPRELAFTICATGIIIAFPGILIVPGVTHALLFITAGGMLKSAYDVIHSPEFQQEYGIDPTKATLAAAGEIIGQGLAHYLVSLGTAKIAQLTPKSVLNLKIPFSKSAQLAIELNPNGYHKVGLFEAQEQNWKSFASFKYDQGFKWHKVPEPVLEFPTMPSYANLNIEELDFRPTIEYFADTNSPNGGGRALKPHDPRNFPDHYPLPYQGIKDPHYNHDLKMHHWLKKDQLTNFLKAPINNDPLIQKVAADARDIIKPSEIIPGVGCREAVFQLLIRTNPQGLGFPVEKLEQLPRIFQRLKNLPGLEGDPENALARFFKGVFLKKDEGLARGAWYELEMLDKVSKLPQYELKEVGRRFTDFSVSSKSREFDIIADYTDQLGTKKIFFESKDRKNLRINCDKAQDMQQTFKAQYEVAKSNDAEFVVLSKGPIDPSWKQWFDERGIHWRENGEMYIPTKVTPSQSTMSESPYIPSDNIPPSDIHQASGLFMMPGIFSVLRQDSNQAASVFPTHEDSQSIAIKEFVQQSFSEALREGLQKYTYQGFTPQDSMHFESNVNENIKKVDESSLHEHYKDSAASLITEVHDVASDHHSSSGYMDPDVYGYRGSPCATPIASPYNRFDLGHDYSATIGGQAYYSNEQGVATAKGAYGKARVEGPLPEMSEKLIEKAVKYVPSAAIIAVGIIAAGTAAYLLYNHFTSCDTIDLKDYPDEDFIDTQIRNYDLKTHEDWEREYTYYIKALEECASFPDQVLIKPYFDIDGYILPFWLYDRTKQLKLFDNADQRALIAMGVPVRLDVLPIEPTRVILNGEDSFAKQQEDLAKTMSISQLAQKIEEFENKLQKEKTGYEEKLTLIKDNVQVMMDTIYRYNQHKIDAHEISIVDSSIRNAFLELYHKAASAHLYEKCLAAYRGILQTQFLLLNILQKQKGFDHKNEQFSTYTFTIDGITQKAFAKHDLSVDSLTTLYATPFQKDIFDKLLTVIESAVTLCRASGKLKSDEKSTLNALCVFVMALAHQAAQYTKSGYTDQAEELTKTALSCLGYTKKLYEHYNGKRAFVNVRYLKIPALGIAHLLKQTIPQSYTEPLAENVEHFVRSLQSALQNSASKFKQECKALGDLIKGALKELSTMPIDLLSNSTLKNGRLSEREVTTLVTSHPLTTLFAYR